MKRVILLIFILLIPSGTSAQSLSDLDLFLVGNDALDVGAGDISSVWVGETQDYLAFVIQFNEVDDLGTSVNITLEDFSDNVYLLSAGIYNETYSVTVNDAITLENTTMLPTSSTIQ